MTSSARMPRARLRLATICAWVTMMVLWSSYSCNIVVCSFCISNRRRGGVALLLRPNCSVADRRDDSLLDYLSNISSAAHPPHVVVIWVRIHLEPRRMTIPISLSPSMPRSAKPPTSLDHGVDLLVAYP